MSLLTALLATLPGKLSDLALSWNDQHCKSL